jgi:sulfatase modifying factor 1
MRAEREHAARRARSVAARALLATAIALAARGASAQVGQRVAVEGFAIDATEVTIGQFRHYAQERGVTTAAERDGGGYEYGFGWERRPGWTWAAPYGAPGADDEPAVHVSWQEAADFCARAGGRLPTFDEWRRAAYTETRSAPTDGHVSGRTYAYPVGDTPAGMNTAGDDPWPRHAPAGATRRGVNGLYEMGANVWEWLADRQGDDALTAGGSWWYGPDKTRVDGAQYKPADFYAVYVGFRCVYDAQR